MSLQTIAPDESGMSNNLDDLSIFVFDDSSALPAGPHPPLAIFLVRLHMSPQVTQPRSRGLVPADWAGCRTWRNVVANLVVDDDRCVRWRVGTGPLPRTEVSLAVLRLLRTTSGEVRRNGLELIIVVVSVRSRDEGVAILSGIDVRCAVRRVGLKEDGRRIAKLKLRGVDGEDVVMSL